VARNSARRTVLVGGSILLFLGIFVGTFLYFGDIDMERARRVHCFGNLRRIGSALSSYHQDEGEYPASLQLLYPKYLDAKDLVCPSDAVQNSEAGVYSSYLYEMPREQPGSEDIVVIEKVGIHEERGDLEAVRGILYGDGTVRLAKTVPRECRERHPAAKVPSVGDHQFDKEDREQEENSN